MNGFFLTLKDFLKIFATFVNVNVLSSRTDYEFAAAVSY